MRRFDRYVLSQLMARFGLFALILVAVYWVNRAVVLFDRIIADGQSAWVFLQLTALTLPNVLRLVLPVAAFAAVVHATRRLAAESELVAAQAMGCSPLRLARPVIAFALLVAALAAVLGHALVPASRAELARRQGEIERNITARLLTEGRFVHPAEGISLYIGKITGAGELRDVFLADARDAEARTDYTAERALLVQSAAGPRLRLIDGTAQTYRPGDRRLATTRFADFTFDVSALIGERGMHHPDPDEIATPRLLAATPALQQRTGADRAGLLFEAHARLAEPLLAAAAALIGFAALMQGSFSRFGVWRQVTGAVAALIAVKLADTMAADLARRDAALVALVYAPGLAGIAAAFAGLGVAARPGLLRFGRPAV